MRNALLAALLALGTCAQGAIVSLKDGSRLQGKIRSANEEQVVLETADGVLTIKTERISRIEPEAPPAAAVPPPPPSVPPPAAPAPAPALPPAPPAPAYVDWPGEFGKGSHLLTLGLGAAIPLGELDFSASGAGSSGRNGDPGVEFDLRYLYQAGAVLGVGVEFDYLGRAPTDSRSLLASADSSVSGGSVVFLGVLRWTLRGEGWARPYAAAAAGAHRTSTVVDAAPALGFAWSDTLTFETRRLYDDHVWGLASSARLGVDFHTRRPVTVSLEAGWTRLEGKSVHPTSSGRDLGLGDLNGPLQFVTVGIKWGYLF